MKREPIIHFISGLGADKIAFSLLKIESGFIRNYVEWIMPLKNESLTDYSQRMVDSYQIKEGDILIGLSFGGIVAVEINKLVKVKQLILISSTAITSGLSPIIRYFGRLGLIKLIPKQRLNKPNPGTHFVFGAATDDEKERLDLFIARGNVELNYWSINQLSNWKNDVKPYNAKIINGDHDKIFRVKKVKPDYIIKGGTHLIVYNKAEEVSAIVNDIIQGLI